MEEDTRDPVARSAVAGLAPLVTLEDAAAFFHVTTRTVRRWIRAGKLSACRTAPTGSGRVLIARADVERFLAELGSSAERDR